jgi:hypothetical protein
LIDTFKRVAEIRPSAVPDALVVYESRWLRHDLRRMRLEKICFIFQTQPAAVLDALDLRKQALDGLRSIPAITGAISLFVVTARVAFDALIGARQRVSAAKVIDVRTSAVGTRSAIYASWRRYRRVISRSAPNICSHRCCASYADASRAARKSNGKPARSSSSAPVHAPARILIRMSAHGLRQQVAWSPAPKAKRRHLGIAARRPLATAWMPP